MRGYAAHTRFVRTHTGNNVIKKILISIKRILTRCYKGESLQLIKGGDGVKFIQPLQNSRVYILMMYEEHSELRIMPKS